LNQITHESLRKLILDINPTVRQYHGNVVTFYTETGPSNANSVDLERSKSFVKKLWARCLEWSNQRPSRIYRSIVQLDDFLESFTYEDRLHDLNDFVQKLAHFKSRKPSFVTEKGHAPNDRIEQMIELFTMFHSVRAKTASLIARFLCLDSNFFGGYHNSSNPPLDRVNYRMLYRLGRQGKLVKKRHTDQQTRKSSHGLELTYWDKTIRG